MSALFQNQKRKRFLILSLALETWLELIPKEKKDWKLVGYLHSYSDDSPLVGYPTDYKVLGDWETFPLTKNDYCLIPVTDCSWKEKFIIS